MPATPIRWQTHSALHLRSWNEEYVAYHALSGDTHLLDSATGHVLSALKGMPAADLDTLKIALAAWADEALLLNVDNILADLAALDLIEAATS